MAKVTVRNFPDSERPAKPSGGAVVRRQCLVVSCRCTEGPGGESTALDDVHKRCARLASCDWSKNRHPIMVSAWVGAYDG